MSGAWQKEGACRTEDPELFFPVGQTSSAKAQAELAKAVCCRCPVMGQCLQWALETRVEDGVWGGTTEEERRSMRRRAVRGKGRPDLSPCGTWAAYRRHLRNHERIDDACREANRRAKDKQTAKRAGQQVAA